MNSDAIDLPPRPPSEPVELVPATRSDRAVLENLGQLYRHDLSESYGLLPNPDGTFNNRPLDKFRCTTDPEHRAWLIKAAGNLGGFVIIHPYNGAMTIGDFFVVRALRRTGVGLTAALMTIDQHRGSWCIGFQRYNAGVERFWSRVATEVVGDAWTMKDDPPAEGRPPDTWISFTTG